MGKEFNLNIGASEDAGKGKGSSGFGFKHTMNMKKAFGKHLTGTDIMSDGYYNQVNKVEGIEGGGSGINMNVPGPMYLKDPDKDDINTTSDMDEDLVLTPEREVERVSKFTRGGKTPNVGERGTGGGDPVIVSTDKFDSVGHGTGRGDFEQEINKARPSKEGEKYDKDGNVIS